MTGNSSVGNMDDFGRLVCTTTDLIPRSKGTILDNQDSLARTKMYRSSLRRHLRAQQHG